MTHIYKLGKIILNRLNFYEKKNKTDKIQISFDASGKPLICNFELKVGNY